MILERFTSETMAMAWLKSEVRLQRVQGAAPMLVGADDIRLVETEDRARGPPPSPR